MLTFYGIASYFFCWPGNSKRSHQLGTTYPSLSHYSKVRFFGIFLELNHRLSPLRFLVVLIPASEVQDPGHGMSRFPIFFEKIRNGKIT